jgi:hypothetical protein
MVAQRRGADLASGCILGSWDDGKVTTAGWRAGGLTADDRHPEPPLDLDEESSIEWRRIVDSMAPNHFIPANYHMLAVLCHHIVDEARLARLICPIAARRTEWT